MYSHPPHSIIAALSELGTLLFSTVFETAGVFPFSSEAHKISNIINQGCKVSAKFKHTKVLNQSQITWALENGYLFFSGFAWEIISTWCTHISHVWT